MSAFYRWAGNDLLLNVRVQPRASNDAVTEVLGDALKVRITAPPVDGKANKHLIAFLAKAFSVAKSDIELVSGQSSRKKQLIIHQPKSLPPIIRRNP